MRYVDKSLAKCPAGWEKRASDALDKVANHGEDVDSHGSVWREYKTTLEGVSTKKCWYCEIIQERSDNGVDHFRPKSHYWWSAFSAENFRFSCIYCNSRRKNPETGKTEGKGIFFPLLDKSTRATCQAEECNESPMLLDPCQPGDPGLLDFNENGIPKPKYAKPESRNERAKISIDLYHLDHPDIVEKRRVRAIELKKSIEEADRIYPRCDTGDPDIDSSFNSILRGLAQALSDNAELSSFSRCVISGYRNKGWVEQLLQTA
jgi:uncharacterized protein (TIGR02646 family)